LTLLLLEYNSIVAFPFLALPPLGALEANLADPLLNSCLAVLEIFFGLRGNIVVVSLESLEVRVPVLRRLDQEGQREHLEGVHPRHIVIVAHVQKHAFFVGQLFVLLHSVVELETTMVNAIFEALLAVLATFLYGGKGYFAIFIGGKRGTLVQDLATDRRGKEGASTQIIYMLLFFPGSPHKGNLGEIFIVRLLPPGASLEDLLHDLKIVAPADKETLELHSAVVLMLLHLLN
jgi:hypothetical protein